MPNKSIPLSNGTAQGKKASRSISGRLHDANCLAKFMRELVVVSELDEQRLVLILLLLLPGWDGG